MNAFDRATSVLHNTLRKHAGSKSRYARGSQSVSITVIPCRTDMDLIDGENHATRASSDDFTINVAALKLAGVAIQPAPGDRITIDGVIYEVMDLPIEGAWRYADQTRTEYRIHTRRIG